MHDRNRKHGWPFWFAVVFVVLPLLYVASFGPACWISSRTVHGPAIVNVAYQPVMLLVMSNTGLGRRLTRYATFAVAPFWTFTQPFDDVTRETGWVEWREVREFF
jgi:heme/copper-type cytochrome/quinol oxidase subunit 4